MKIFSETKKLVAKEKEYTIKILQNLMMIERDKLFTRLRYGSLHAYLVRELKYTDQEALLRVNTVRLMTKSEIAKKNIENGKLSLSNASRANVLIKDLKINKSTELNEVIEKASTSSKRKFEEFIDEKYQRPRKEIVVLDDRVLKKFDRYRKRTNQKFVSNYEVIQILLEKELKSFCAQQRFRERTIVSNTRYIPKLVKAQVYTGECANCGKKWDLEYDHIKKISHGGNNDPSNLQILCRACNQAKEIEARQTGFFA